MNHVSHVVVAVGPVVGVVADKVSCRSWKILRYYRSFLEEHITQICGQSCFLWHILVIITQKYKFYYRERAGTFCRVDSTGFYNQP